MKTNNLDNTNIFIPEEYALDILGVAPDAKVNVKTALSFVLGVLAYITASASLLYVWVLGEQIGENGKVNADNVWMLYFSIMLMITTLLVSTFAIVLSRSGLQEVYAYRMRGRMFGWLGQILSWVLGGMIVLPILFLSLMLLAEYWNS